MYYTNNSPLKQDNSYLRNNKQRQGTIYLQGEQVYFQTTVANALNVHGNDHLTFDISIDLFQSWKNGKITYRVEYAIERQ